MYMLKSVGDRIPPCGTPVMNWRCVDVSECSVCFAVFVVCYKFENDACVGFLFGVVYV